MKKSICLSLSAACALCALAIASVAYSTSACSESVPNDCFNDTAAKPVYWSEVDSPSDETASRILQKQEVAKALIFGEITFDEAAAGLRELGGNEVPVCLRQLHPGATDAEIWYHQVIAFVKGLGFIYPDRVPALVPRLESEVAQRFSGAPAYALAPTVTVQPYPVGQTGAQSTSPQTE